MHAWRRCTRACSARRSRSPQSSAALETGSTPTRSIRGRAARTSRARRTAAQSLPHSTHAGRSPCAGHWQCTSESRPSLLRSSSAPRGSLGLRAHTVGDGLGGSCPRPRRHHTRQTRWRARPTHARAATKEEDSSAREAAAAAARAAGEAMVGSAAAVAATVVGLQVAVECVAEEAEVDECIPSLGRT